MTYASSIKVVKWINQKFVLNPRSTRYQQQSSLKTILSSLRWFWWWLIDDWFILPPTCTIQYVCTILLYVQYRIAKTRKVSSSSCNIGCELQTNNLLSFLHWQANAYNYPLYYTRAVLPKDSLSSKQPCHYARHLLQNACHVLVSMIRRSCRSTKQERSLRL